jgi:hypothetical protein
VIEYQCVLVVRGVTALRGIGHRSSLCRSAAGDDGSAPPSRAVGATNR